MQDNNLETLKILFIIKGVLALLITLVVGFFILGIGTAIIHEVHQQQEEIPFSIAAFISSVGIFLLILSIIMTVLTFLAAKYIAERKNHTFIVVISVLTCLSGILGLFLGVFAIIELHKSHVKPLFLRGTDDISDVLY